jgi:hypothetical protein
MIRKLNFTAFKDTNCKLNPESKNKLKLTDNPYYLELIRKKRVRESNKENEEKRKVKTQTRKIRFNLSICRAESLTLLSDTDSSSCGQFWNIENGLQMESKNLQSSNKPLIFQISNTEELQY